MKVLTQADYVERRASLVTALEKAKADYATASLAAAVDDAVSGDQRAAQGERDRLQDQLAALDVAYREQGRVADLRARQALHDAWSASSDEIQAIGEEAKDEAIEVGILIEQVAARVQGFIDKRASVREIAARHRFTRPFSAGDIGDNPVFRFNTATAEENREAREAVWALEGLKKKLECLGDEGARVLWYLEPPLEEAA